MFIVSIVKVLSLSLCCSINANLAQCERAHACCSIKSTLSDVKGSYVKTAKEQECNGACNGKMCTCKKSESTQQKLSPTAIFSSITKSLSYCQHPSSQVLIAILRPHSQPTQRMRRCLRKLSGHASALVCVTEGWVWRELSCPSPIAVF